MSSEWRWVKIIRDAVKTKVDRSLLSYDQTIQNVYTHAAVSDRYQSAMYDQMHHRWCTFVVYFRSQIMTPLISSSTANCYNVSYSLVFTSILQDYGTRAYLVADGTSRGCMKLATGKHLLVSDILSRAQYRTGSSSHRLQATFSIVLRPRSSGSGNQKIASTRLQATESCKCDCHRRSERWERKFGHDRGRCYWRQSEHSNKAPDDQNAPLE